MTWCFPDEEAQKAQGIDERIAEGAKISVPPFWRHEILNALLVGERRKRLTREHTEAFLRDLARLPVDLDDRDAAFIFFNMQSLSRHYGLTAYDAAYLELALRRRCPLATLDRALAKAARAEAAPLIGEGGV